MYSMRFDMRAPDFGATTAEPYQAAVDMCVWAETRGCLEAACRAYDHQPGMTLLPDRNAPSVCFVAPDVDVAWREIGPHLLHDARAYAEWNPGNQTSVGIADVSDVVELRTESPTHRIFTADEAIAHIRGGGILT